MVLLSVKDHPPGVSPVHEVVDESNLRGLVSYGHHPSLLQQAIKWNLLRYVPLIPALWTNSFEVVRPGLVSATRDGRGRGDGCVIFGLRGCRADASGIPRPAIPARSSLRRCNRSCRSSQEAFNLWRFRANGTPARRLRLAIRGSSGMFWASAASTNSMTMSHFFCPRQPGDGKVVGPKCSPVRNAILLSP
jgi:hypothetical protein